MSFAPSPTQSNALTALRSFLISIMPDGVEVVQGQDNLTPEPAGDDFVIMTPFMIQRLSTNVDTYQDVSFTAAIAGPVMTVSQVAFGTLAIGQTVFGIGVSANTKISAFGTGSGGVGTYTLSATQNVTSRKMASGGETLMQPARIQIQVDVHGPNSSENAQTISTLFRDDYAFQAFKASGFDVVPITADDPKQLPFTNESQQVENRWVIDVVMQSNQMIRVPKQFADELQADLIDVDAVYPA